MLLRCEVSLQSNFYLLLLSISPFSCPIHPSCVFPVPATVSFYVFGDFPSYLDDIILPPRSLRAPSYIYWYNIGVPDLIYSRHSCTVRTRLSETKRSGPSSLIAKFLNYY